MTISRRRFLTVMAGCAPSASGARSASADGVAWHGRALGADAEIRLFGTDERQAQNALRAAQDTLARMERLFSLYQPTSALNRLNESGNLMMPPEFARLIGVADRIHRLSGGLFDPTVQPLMVAQARARHGLSETDLRSLAGLIGWSKVELKRSHLRFSVPGMAMTLNGIAQGFATDRVSEVLTAHGFDPYLVHVGEFRAGRRSSRIGIASTKGGILERIELENAALATSAPFGTLFENGSGHILRPDLSRAEPRWKSVTVMGRTAAEADGLSTALALTTSTDLAEKAVSEDFAQTVWLEDAGGELLRI
ncbi:FAD:protein FMN transferase [uncultured Roseibium sp.]|uniref:FAD:protein FMN transferase n=1 Tax=uncultured Roseibium sp. TaxID=1936171 RepID=UPI0026131420|nr:FAD:protein FMN transferase [uncultured Roseibium sp.]